MILLSILELISTTVLLTSFTILSPLRGGVSLNRGEGWRRSTYKCADLEAA